MPDLVLLSVAQKRRIEPFFPRPRGLPCVDDRRVISGIVCVLRHRLQWKDAPSGYEPPKTLYNRFVRWSRLGVFARIFAALAAEDGPPERLMIDATHLKAHRTAASLLQKGGPPYRPHQGRTELQAARRLRRARPARGAAALRGAAQRPPWCCPAAADHAAGR